MTETKNSQAATQEILLNVDVGEKDDAHTTSFPADVPKSKVLRSLKLLGFLYVREGKHIILHRENDDGSKTPLTLPNHNKIKGSTLRRICREAGIARDDFLNTYYSL
jgi:hypothetical protein